MPGMLEARIAILEAQVAALARQNAHLTTRRGTPFALARTTLAASDGGAVQMVQARMDALSLRDNIPILYHYEYFGSPPVGADLHLAFLDGDRSKAVAIASGHQSHRMTGAATGDAGLYAQGMTIHLTSGGILIGGNVTLTGNLSVTGAISATGEVTAKSGGGSVTLSQHHGHQSGSSNPPVPGT